MSLGKNLFNKTGSSGGGPGGGLPVGNKPAKGNGSGITLGIPTKVDPLAGQKAAEIKKNPGMTFNPNKVNVAKNTISSQGTKPGNQVTKPGKSTYTYKGKKSSGVYDALNKEISGGLAKTKYGYEGTDVKEYEQLKLSKRKGQAGVGEVKGKPTTTVTPGAEASVETKIELPDNPAEETTNGETTVETKTTPDDKTTTESGKLGNLPFGSAGATKKSRGRTGSNPIKPVSLATSASQSKDYNLKLNNQAVNKA